MAADAAHFSEEQVLDALEELPRGVGAKAGQICQFSLLTDASVIIEILWGQEDTRALILGIAANRIDALIRRLFARRGDVASGGDRLLISRHADPTTRSCSSGDGLKRQATTNSTRDYRLFPTGLRRVRRPCGSTK